MGRNLKYQDIKNFIESKEGNGCKLLMTEEEFEQEKIKQKKSGSRIKLKIQCGCENKNIFYVIFDKFKRRNQRKCSDCLGHVNKYTYQYFKDFINGKQGNGCELLTNESEYKDGKSKLKIKCSCGNEFYIHFDRFKNKNIKQCEECRDEWKKLDYIKRSEQFLEKVKDQVGNEYTVLGKYINAGTKILVRHNCDKCNNYEYEVAPNNFIGGKRRCPKCMGRLPKTTEEYKKDLEKKSNGEIILLGEYNIKKIKVKHLICGCEWESDPYYIIKTVSCPICNNSPKKRSHDDFIKEVYDLVGDEYTVLSEFTRVDDKIKIRHNCNECSNYEFEIIPFNFLRGQRCSFCGRKIFGEKKTKLPNKFEEDFYSLAGEEYTLLSKYSNSRSKINVRHNMCGYEYEVIANSFICGARCPKCFGTMKKTTEQFKQEVYDLVEDEYAVLGEYVNTATKILIKHNKCNTIYDATPNSFLTGSRCPKCMRPNFDKDTKQIIKEVYNLVGDEYTVLSEYINSKTKILIKHNCDKCRNYEFEMIPNNFLYGQRCPYCAESRGEQVARHYCEKNNILFNAQYMFDDLLSDLGNELRFDFAIFKNEEKTNLKYLIEYDGEQHYRWVKGMMSEEDFIKLQYHDKLKNEYCNSHNIKLIRIPYWDFDNIEEILTDILINNNIKSKYIINN